MAHGHRIRGTWLAYKSKARAARISAEISRRRPIASAVNVADNSLAAFVDVDVFNSDLLLPFAPVSIERLEQRCVGSGELVRLIQILSPAFKSLLSKHRAPITFHRGVVAGEQLRRQHSLEFVLRRNPRKQS